MDQIAEIAHEYYNNDLRGGEGHMEVGKLIMNVVDSKAHMTLSVKPFGCMPSAGVSDGVQSLDHREVPRHHLLPGRDERRRRGELLLARADVPVQGASRRREAEYEARCQQQGVTPEQLALFMAKHPRFQSPFFWPAAHGGRHGLGRGARVAPYLKDPLHGVKKLAGRSCLRGLFQRAAH